MATDTVCCEPCAALRMCQPKHNCCLECHFSYEEELALPHLPLPLRRLIQSEHARLIREGLPPAAVEMHSAWEEKIFRMYCPPQVCEMIERDHAAHSHGDLQSRDPENWRRPWSA